MDPNLSELMMTGNLGPKDMENFVEYLIYIPWILFGYFILAAVTSIAVNGGTAEGFQLNRVAAIAWAILAGVMLNLIEMLQ